MKEIIFNTQKVTPTKVVCIGRNYVEHIEELGNEIPEHMVIFNKPNSAITDQLHYFDPVCRFEGELCLLIKSGEIAGIGLGLDLTHAEIQNRQKENGLPWERAKAFDGSAVLSTFISFQGDISDLRFDLSINDVITQEADYALMMYKPKQMIAEISSFMTLEDYDIIMTGTPKGVGTYHRGDLFKMRLYTQDTLLMEAHWKAE